MNHTIEPLAQTRYEADRTAQSFAHDIQIKGFKAQGSQRIDCLANRDIEFVS